MSKRIQCVSCENAEYGEDLYYYDGDILCRYCIVSIICETSIPCEYFGECNDTTKKPKKCDCANKDDRIAGLEKELSELKENAIVPKFKVGDCAYYVDEFSINKVKIINRNIEAGYDCINETIEETLIKYNHCFNEGELEETELFATKEEAKAKLKELERN